MSGISTATLSFFADLLERETGNTLDASKSYLIVGRLTPLARKLGYASLEKFAEAAGKPMGRDVREAIVDQLTTHETSFFRDIRPFERLGESILPTLDLSRPVKIWSAACSTGQEAYSIAMLLKEQAVKHPRLRFEIVGTDISKETVERAKAGVYNEFEIKRGLSDERQRKYFTADGPREWRVNDDLRRTVQFRVDNILEPSVPRASQDLIFCRYVLIYLERDVKRRALDQITQRFRIPHGRLFLGASESTLGLSEDFEWSRAEGSGVFQLKAAA